MHTFRHVTPSNNDMLDPEKMELLELVDRALILQTKLPEDVYDVYSLMKMDEPQLRIVLDKLRDLDPTPAPSAPATRSERPIAYVDPYLPDRPAWRPPHARREPLVKPKKDKGPRRVVNKLAPEDRPQRYKAQLWHNGYSIHLGMFNSIEARDAAVDSAKIRRSLGLPITGIAPKAPGQPLGDAPAPRAGVGKRFRAVVWDPEIQSPVHIGFFPTVEARDEAVEQAKGRRAIGLPIKGA